MANFKASNLRALVRRVQVQQVELVALAIMNAAIRKAPIDTGELVQSIRARPMNAEGTVWRVSAHAPHALHVEFGTYKTRAQPYLRPAVAQVLNSL